MTPQKKPRIKPMTPGVPSGARVRAYLAGAIVTCGLLGVAYRAWGLQVEDGQHFRQLAERQHAITVGIPAPRGDVIDSRDRPLAVSADTDSVWADPRVIRDVTDTAEKLAKLINLDAGVLESKLGGDHRFVWLARHVTPEMAKAVRDAKLAGIEVAREPRRWYPGKTIGGMVIGRSDIDGQGVDGIEMSMNALLVGRHASSRGVRDARGRAMLADGLVDAQPGATIKLTLDRTIQSIADDAVSEIVQVKKAKAGTVAVLDVATGKVLALASYPHLDPNSSDPPGPARNRAVTDSYEAGSVMKLFTVATALDAGMISPDTEFDLHGGSLMIKGRGKPITDVDHDKYLTTSGIIKRSSNVGAALIGMRLGKDALYDGLRKFGFGKRTGVELPGEQSGNLRGGRWRDVELATISYGYGITTTPLQVAAGVAAIGNHGVYHAPRIIESITDADGVELYRHKTDERRVLSDKTASQIVAMMATVFDKDPKGGTAKGVVIPGFKCAGKTGTAHKYDPETKTYAEHRYLSSFVGLAPLDHPRLAIAVLIDDASGGDYFGALVAGPVFSKVASEGLRYLGVPGEALPVVMPKVVASPEPEQESSAPEPM